MQNCQEIRLPICFMKKAWLKYLENIGKYHLTWQVWVVLGVKFPWKLTATAVFQVLLINKLCVLPTNNEGLKLRSLSNLSFSYDQSMVEDQSTNKKRKKKKHLKITLPSDILPVQRDFLENVLSQPAESGVSEHRT